MTAVFESFVLLLLLLLLGAVIAWGYLLHKRRTGSAVIQVPDYRMIGAVQAKLHDHSWRLLTESRMAEIVSLAEDDPRLVGLGGLNCLELLVAELMAEAFSIPRIAEHFRIAQTPIAVYGAYICKRLGVRIRSEMALTWKALKTEALRVPPA